jgi:HPr kinase/phosphorylase
VRDFFYQFKEELGLSLKTPETSLVTEIIEANLHRPGLALAGFTEVFSYQRIQVIGTTEWFYMEAMGAQKRKELFDRLKVFRSPLWVLTHNAGLHDELLQMCLEQNVPVLTTSRETNNFCAEVQDILEDWFTSSRPRRSRLLVRGQIRSGSNDRG